PNGQLIRSLFSESKSLEERQRVTRMVRLLIDGVTEYAEVRFYFRDETLKPFALVSLFSRPDMALWEKSLKTVWACTKLGDNGLKVVPIETIECLVSMQP
ncbi:hypothetical protein BKA70DRAFT_1080435, partial [Coprinopsis sp. MPI-PUGE-AT-0042]